MRNIEDIIIEWRVEFGVSARGKTGKYYYIDYAQKKDLLTILIRTIIDEGYDEDVVKSVTTRNLIINGCEAPDGASSRSSSKIKKSKNITADNLKEIIPEFFRGKFSIVAHEKEKIALPEKPQTTFEQPKVEKIPEIDPKDRIKMDTSDVVDGELDLDFLKELGIDESFVGTKNE